MRHHTQSALSLLPRRSPSSPPSLSLLSLPFPPLSLSLPQSFFSTSRSLLFTPRPFLCLSFCYIQTSLSSPVSYLILSISASILSLTSPRSAYLPSLAPSLPPFLSYLSPASAAVTVAKEGTNQSRLHPASFSLAPSLPPPPHASPPLSLPPPFPAHSR